MQDAFAGMSYTFCVTLVLLYTLKILLYGLRKVGVSDGNDEALILDKLEASPQYTWRRAE